MFKRYLSRFPHALNGLRYAFFRDFGFRTQVYLGVAIAFVVLAFLLPLSEFELLFVILSYVLILITELQNSALELVLDKLHPEQDGKIKISKDMAAAAVLMSGLFLLIVLATIIYGRI